MIRPREGVNPQDLAIWLEANFQMPGTPMSLDAGPNAEQIVTVRGGNPLVNASIFVAEERR